MLITVTGGSGTIGTAVTTVLAAERTPVRNVDLRPPSPPNTAADHQLPTPITDRWHSGSYATDP